MVKKTTTKKKYTPNSKEKYMCAKHKKFFTEELLNWKKDIIIKRINGSKKRPLAVTLSETDLEKLINERAKIYSLADFTINCDQLNKNEIANKIIKKYEAKNNKS